MIFTAVGFGLSRCVSPLARFFSRSEPMNIPGTINERTVAKILAMTEADKRRFWLKVFKQGDGCWLWWGAIGKGGYGNFWIGPLSDGVYARAHNVSYILAGNPSPAGLNVLHDCDNPRCVRPDHLFPGTAKDNADDRDAKGRHRFGILPNCGEDHANSQLTEADVLAIRAARLEGKSYREIALNYSVSALQIGKIIRRERWRHVP